MKREIPKAAQEKIRNAAIDLVNHNRQRWDLKPDEFLEMLTVAAASSIQVLCHNREKAIEDLTEGIRNYIAQLDRINNESNRTVQ